MKEFDQFIADNKDRQIAVTKIKNLNSPENGKSMIRLCEPFVGQVILHYHEESRWGSGFQILVDGGYTFSSSLVREVVRKGPNTWIAKTMNSVYKVEVVK